MTLLEQALVFLMLLGTLLAVAGVVAYVAGRRALRRRLHGVRTHVATRGVLTTMSLLAAWREWAGAHVTPESASRGTAARTRRRLWAAIADAEAAVQHADASHAPVGDLPAVCRSLRRVAGELDTLLRLERRLPMQPTARPVGVRQQVADVIRAARDVQSAALHACSDANAPRLRALIRDAGGEVDMVAAAVARMRSISPS